MFAIGISKAYSKNKSVWIWLCISACFIFSIARVSQLIHFYDAPTYVQDQWGLMNPILTGENLMQSFFTQHGSHFLGLGGACSYILVTIFGFVPITESYSVLFTISLCAMLFLWLKVRLVGSLQITDGIIPLVVLNLNQHEIFTWVAHGSVAALPLALCAATGLVLTLKPSATKYTLLTIVQFFSLFTGYAFILGCILFAGLLLSFIWDKQLYILKIFHVCLQLLFTCLFFYLYTYPEQNSGVSFFAVPVSNYLSYLSEMLLHFFGNLENRKRDLFMLFVVLFIPIVFIIKGITTTRLTNHQREILSVLFCFTMIYVSLNTLARVPIGQIGARSPRYITFLLPAFLSLYFILAIFSQKGSVKWSLLLLLLCVGYTVTTFKDTQRIITTVAITNAKINTWNSCFILQQDAELCADKELFQVLPNKIEKYIPAINAFYNQKL